MRLTIPSLTRSAFLLSGLLVSGCAADYLSDGSPFPGDNPGIEPPRVTMITKSCMLGSGSSVLAAGHLHDGKLDDLVAGSSTKSELIVLRSSGSGDCGVATTYALGASPSALAIGSLDADSVPDVVAGSAADNQISVLLNNGDGTLKARVPYTFPGPIALAIGNVDGKPGSDVVAIGSTNNSVQILENQGSGSFTLQGSQFGGGRLLFALSLLPGMSGLDLALVSPLDDRLDVLSSQGSNLWTLRQALLPEGMYAPVAVQSADLDGNGLADLVVIGNNSNNAAVLLQRTAGHFDTRRVQLGDGPVAVAIADLNQDRLLDFAVLQAGDSSLQLVFQVEDKPSQVRYFVTNAESKVAVGKLPVAVVAADLDGNGEPELVVADKEEPALQVVFSRGLP